VRRRLGNGRSAVGDRLADEGSIPSSSTQPSSLAWATKPRPEVVFGSSVGGADSPRDTRATRENEPPVDSGSRHGRDTGASSQAGPTPTREEGDPRPKSKRIPPPPGPYYNGHFHPRVPTGARRRRPADAAAPAQSAGFHRRGPYEAVSLEVPIHVPIEVPIYVPEPVGSRGQPALRG